MFLQPLKSSVRFVVELGSILYLMTGEVGQNAQAVVVQEGIDMIFVVVVASGNDESRFYSDLSGAVVGFFI